MTMILKRKQFIMKWKNAKRGMDISDQWDKRIEIKQFFGGITRNFNLRNNE
jgi:hypothetical protein